MDLFLYVTNKCNMRCTYCFGQKYVFQNNSIISKAYLQKLISLMKKNKKIINSITFDSGEPLIAWKEIHYLISSLAKNGLTPKYTLLTNGLVLTSDKIEFCSKHAVDLKVSFSGLEHVFLKNKDHTIGIDHKKCYGLILKNIKNAIAQGVKISYNYVACPNTIAYLPESINFMLCNKMLRILITPEGGIYWKKKDKTLLEQQLAKVRKLILDKIYSKELDLNFIHEYIEQTIFDLKIQMFTQQRTSIMVLNYDGNIYNDESFIFVPKEKPLYHIDTITKLTDLKKASVPETLSKVHFFNKALGNNNTDIYKLILTNWLILQREIKILQRKKQLPYA